jgi:signal transduction histidine kinase
LTAVNADSRERALILAPRGRDAMVAKSILHEAGVHADICVDQQQLVKELTRGADVAIVTEEATRGVDVRPLVQWIASQPAWSDFPFILLTQHGGGVERNPTAASLVQTLGNVTFLERPFHPTTLVSMVHTNLRGRRRQYECRKLNEELESRVHERTSELASANRRLLGQIEERERVESTLNQLQRLEAVGQLTSGVAHDFNNLLTVVLGNIGFLEKSLRQGAGSESMLQRLGYMRVAAERGAKLTDHLLSFSRRQRLEPRSLDLTEAVSAMRDLLQSTLGGSIRIDTRLRRDLWPAMADPTQLELAVLNLAINARDAMEVGGTLHVETENVALGPPAAPEEPPAGEYVSICVADTGSGMTPEVRAKVFEPFFTTKEVGKGSGLGLSQVLGFAKQSGGGVRIVSSVGEGASVYIYLPRASARAAPEVGKPRDASDGRSVREAVILLVDDDNAVREVTSSLLHDLGYFVLEAGSGGAALELLEHEQRIDLMLIDFAMPGMNGAEIARLARSARPGMPILFVTGYADRAALAGVDERHIIGKPFLDDELTTKIRLALREERQEEFDLVGPERRAAQGAAALRISPTCE